MEVFQQRKLGSFVENLSLYELAVALLISYVPLRILILVMFYIRTVAFIIGEKVV
jgi:hypothetical protein